MLHNIEISPQHKGKGSLLFYYLFLFWILQLLQVVWFCFFFFKLLVSVWFWKWFWICWDLHEYWSIVLGKKKKRTKFKLQTWLYNQLSPVGKVGNVVLWDSISVSISCLHVHFILNNPIQPSCFHSEILPHYPLV